MGAVRNFSYRKLNNMQVVKERNGMIERENEREREREREREK